MHIDITARHDTLNEALKEHVTHRFSHALRLADDVTSVHVVLDHERARHSAEVVVHGRNLAAAVHADGDDHFLAVDRCADKLRHQLEHHLGRRRDKRRRNPGLKAAEAEVAARLAAQEADLTMEPVASSAGDGNDGQVAQPEAAAAPAIVRSGAAVVTRSLEDALGRFESSAESFLVYRDSGTLRVSILHRRDDGQVGLVEIEA